MEIKTAQKAKMNQVLAPIQKSILASPLTSRYLLRLEYTLIFNNFVVSLVPVF